MSKKLTQLVARRQYLVAATANQRARFAQNAQSWRAPLARMDRGIAAFHYIRRHPALLGGISLIIAVLRPQHRGKWLKIGLLGWQLGRKLLKNRTHYRQFLRM
ncbi:hypothetical protein CAP31_06005 [Sulfuriferula sp. AH1]|uniref:YqjK-like family protein n=1 Tax=Sulfuriferula sp. AH1 TaxID=1985873 RepID=UPI000B3B163C|nr:YqjK-like family protein [Sulfuriferula sp. AH1]ARU31278.1 hypothetical protein CAP31_06005 [Sulfuriferula sp. AH1]